MTRVEQRKSNPLSDLDGKMDLYGTYCRTSSFTVAVEEETCFDHNTGTAYLAAKDLNSGRDPKLIDFDVMHELGHLMQLHTDPQGYRKLIEDTKADEPIFEFFNCLLDVSSNSMLSNRNAQYRQGAEPAPFVKDYYADQLFPNKDLSRHPLCQQFSYMLLLEGMSCAGNYQISPEVEEILNTSISVFGNNTTVADFVRASFKEPANPNGFTVSNLRFLADSFLRPIFEKLREQDNRAGRVPTDFKSGPKMFSEGDIQNAIKSAIAVEAGKTKPAEQRSQDMAVRQILDSMAPDARETPAAHDFAKRYAAKRPQIAELAELWRKIRREVFGSEVTEVRGATRGHDLSIPHVIRHFSAVQKGLPDQPIMIQHSVEATVEMHPKIIWIHVVLDQSRSVVEFMSSIKDGFVSLFGSFVAYSLSREENSPEILSSLHVYSDDSNTLLEKGTHVNIADLQKAYSKLAATNGTQSHHALSKVEQEILLNKVNSGEEEIIHIVIEVTDGETGNPTESKNIIDRLKARGAICCGIKFVGPDRPDSVEQKPDSPEFTPGDFFDQMYKDRGRKIVSSGFSKALKDLLEDIIVDDV